MNQNREIRVKKAICGAGFTIRKVRIANWWMGIAIRKSGNVIRRIGKAICKYRNVNRYFRQAILAIRNAFPRFRYAIAGKECANALLLRRLAMRSESIGNKAAATSGSGTTIVETPAS